MINPSLAAIRPAKSTNSNLWPGRFSIDLANAYPARIGEWDKVAIDYGYRDFPTGTNEHQALDKIRSGMAKEGISPEEGGLRLGVLGGGCSGLSYSIRFDTRPRERDRIYDFDGVRVFVDPKSFLYLHGMTLDYEETLMRQGFNFINPNSTRSCGCGSSFSS